jgi:hypothetical protein
MGAIILKLKHKEHNLIPEYTMNALNLYVEHGIVPGSFLCAVLENNLVRAVGRADRENLAALPDIVKYIYNELPSTCWGSPARVNEYLESKMTANQGEQA